MMVGGLYSETSELQSAGFYKAEFRVQGRRGSTFEYTHTHTHTHTHIHTHTHTHTYIHAYIHTHTHIKKFA